MVFADFSAHFVWHDKLDGRFPIWADTLVSFLYHVKFDKSSKYLDEKSWNLYFKRSYSCYKTTF